MDELLKELRAKLAKKLDERAAQKTAQAEILKRAKEDNDGAGRDLTAEESAEMRAASDKKTEIDTEIGVLEARAVEVEDEIKRDEAADRLRREHPSARPATVTSEERTYTAESARTERRSFFSDAYALTFQPGNFQARSRIERHMREVEVEREKRAVGTSAFAGMVVPQYLTDLYGAISRNGRPVANLMRGLPLPADGMSLFVPKATTGATVASQATENTSVSNTDMALTNVNPSVVTISGQQDVSRQAIERGTMTDMIVYQDLAAAYAAELDRQVINGSGAANQMLGILQTAGIYTATAFGAVPSMANIASKVAGGIASIYGAGVIVAPARIIVMHPRRWGFLLAQSDTTGRPQVPAAAAGPQNAQGAVIAPGEYSVDEATGRTVKYVGFYQGLPVVLDANVPVNIGTNSEDVIVPMNNDHGLLWEDGDGSPQELRFEQTLGNQLTVKLVVYGYAAFTAARYPLAFSRIGGADATATFGLVTPTF
jgi:HK97 family phage major capsid protein